jgi:predicted DNA binding CopG/RHH family protein
MKSSKRNTKKDDSKSDVKRWEKAAALFESEDEALMELLALSQPVSPEEHRQILGAGNRKPISIRIPENDLAEIQKIALANGRKYQQLIVQAVELYIDNYYRLVAQDPKKAKEA